MAGHKCSLYKRLADPHCTLALPQAPQCNSAPRASGFSPLLPPRLHLPYTSPSSCTGAALYYNAGALLQTQLHIHSRPAAHRPTTKNRTGAEPGQSNHYHAFAVKSSPSSQVQVTATQLRSTTLCSFVLTLQASLFLLFSTLQVSLLVVVLTFQSFTASFYWYQRRRRHVERKVAQSKASRRRL